MRKRDKGDGSNGKEGGGAGRDQMTTVYGVECWILATTIKSRVGLRREASSSSMWTEPAEIARMNSASVVFEIIQVPTI
jgi:hypothetical protein